MRRDRRWSLRHRIGWVAKRMEPQVMFALRPSSFAAQPKATECERTVMLYFKNWTCTSKKEPCKYWNLFKTNSMITFFEKIFRFKSAGTTNENNRKGKRFVLLLRTALRHETFYWASITCQLPGDVKTLLTSVLLSKEFVINMTFLTPLLFLHVYKTQYNVNLFHYYFLK